MSEEYRNEEWSWTVREMDGKWYWFNDQGRRSIPYDDEDQAIEGLSDYDATYYD